MNTNPNINFCFLCRQKCYQVTSCSWPRSSRTWAASPNNIVWNCLNGSGCHISRNCKSRSRSLSATSEQMSSPFWFVFHQHFKSFVTLGIFWHVIFWFMVVLQIHAVCKFRTPFSNISNKWHFIVFFQNIMRKILLVLYRFRDNGA